MVFKLSQPVRSGLAKLVLLSRERRDLANATRLNRVCCGGGLALAGASSSPCFYANAYMGSPLPAPPGVIGVTVTVAPTTTTDQLPAPVVIEAMYSPSSRS